MAYYGFQNILYMWESWGLTDVILPFLLIFAVVFAALEQVKVFGEDKRRIHVIIALVIGLSVIIPHVTNTYPPGSDVVDIINFALPQIALIIIAIVMVLVLVGMFGESNVTWIVALLAILVVGYIFARAANWVPTYRLVSWLDDPTIQSVIIILLVFGLAIWMIAGPKNRTPGESFLRGVGKLFKRGH